MPKYVARKAGEVDPTDLYPNQWVIMDGKSYIAGIHAYGAPDDPEGERMAAHLTNLLNEHPLPALPALPSR